MKIMKCPSENNLNENEISQANCSCTFEQHILRYGQTGEEVMSEKMEINGENGKMVENTFGKLLEVM